MNYFTAKDMQKVDQLLRSEGQNAAEGGTDYQNSDATRMPPLADGGPMVHRRRALSPIVISGLVRTLEFLLVLATGLIVHKIYVKPPIGTELYYYSAILAMSFATLVIFHALDLTQISAMRMPLRSGLRLAGGWGLVFLTAMALVFFLKLDGIFSRVWLLAWFVVGFLVLTIERTAIAFIIGYLTRLGRLDRRAVIVGGGQPSERILRDLAEQTNSDLRIYGFFDDRTDLRSPDVIAGFPKLGTVDDLVDFARQSPVDLVIVTLPISAEQRLLQMLRKLWVLPIDIRLAAHMNKLRFRPRSYSYIGTVPVLDVFDKPIADWDLVLKATFDRVVGALCLLLVSPIMLAVAIAVKTTSSGSILFKQKRHGFNNETIEVYKFRSMYTNQLDLEAAKQVTRNDPRVTPVGRFIRRTSLDELPQLFNVVFKGNLSLVGPRPHVLHGKAQDRLYDKVVDGYFARHRVRPGITGWAQVNGWRGETDTPEKIQGRVEHDLYYIENWSLVFDAYILLVTPLSLIKTKNAY
ncbi:MAG: undecaprenyl-phosphate glucose phosphotransferase [Hyphomicrobiales bacterium]|nr:undecaprenyl-phosphate glucose phosphotransferase [Hyphomicrobiales bacterium]MDE2113942.1 undecaprenyl-phosphate glucose phosphotransferase [Hyphomicrobiales bacterium]